MSKNKHLRVFFFLLLVANACFVKEIQGDVEDFESSRSTNIIGGKSSSWEKSLESKEKFEKLAELPEDEFLELISIKLFNYFWNETSPRTGFIKDRNTPNIPSSIAATGFGLTAICIADYRDWILHEQAYNRVKKTLTAIKYKAAHQHGFYYHFIDMDTGQRMWKSEVSSVDTALLLAGIVVVREYFSENDIKKLCDEIYDKINWKWMMDDRSKALYMGWSPEGGFDKFILWDMFAEEMVMYILGMGAKNNPLPEESWHSFRRPVKKYKKYTYIYCETESLFTYLFSHAYIDFRRKHDKYADYWRNSTRAIKSSIEFTKNHKDFYRTYREGFWGISAGDGPDGYKNHGASEKILNAHDGTVVPYAMCGAVPFMHKEAVSGLKKLLSGYGEKVWDDNYGFVSSFNLDRNWFSTEHIGIDLGISLLMIENYRSGFVWKYFMKNENVKQGMKKAGFKKGIKKTVTGSTGEIVKTGDKLIQKEYRARKTNSTAALKEEDFIKFDISSDIEYGEINGLKDVNAKFAFTWDDEFLHFIIEVTDDTVLAERKKEELYKDDCIELYLSPNSDMLIWGNSEYFQIGFAPDRIVVSRKLGPGAKLAELHAREFDLVDGIELADARARLGRAGGNRCDQGRE